MRREGEHTHTHKKKRRTINRYARPRAAHTKPKEETRKDEIENGGGSSDPRLLAAAAVN